MKKSAIIGAILLGVMLVMGVIFFITRGDTLDKAIDQYEGGDYIDAITMLNRLVKTAGYDESEKIHYYRCRAINSLAEELEEDFEDELVITALENRDKPEYEKAHQKITARLAGVNAEIEGDIEFVAASKKSRIIPRGLFYNDFVSRYRGSQYIEDLDFYEIKKIRSIEPARLFDYMERFYKKYPNSTYVPQIVTIIFDAMRDGATLGADSGEFLKNIILGYALRFPTSQEVSRIYTSAGDNVNMRNSPGLNGAMAGKTVKDEILIQLEKSMDTMQVGDTRDYWYRVSTLKGQRGWIFGKFLKPVDIQGLALANNIEAWSMEDYFTAWTDSNTPENWTHIEGADKTAVIFRKQLSGNLLVFGSKGQVATGLFTRVNTTRSFRLLVRARFVSGYPVTLAAYIIEKDFVYSISAGSEKIEVNGRSIPLKTSDWHNYELSSDDGKFASLTVDGQLISGRIPAGSDQSFSNRGIYILCQQAGSGQTSAEIEYIKVR
ncbi:MAG: SH3 domain-containing protein [Spirochaetes bacterium]|nr:SH3 domain-containing protein [Spirochaetota bacterium]